MTFYLLYQSMFVKNHHNVIQFSDHIIPFLRFWLCILDYVKFIVRGQAAKLRRHLFLLLVRICVCVYACACMHENLLTGFEGLGGLWSHYIERNVGKVPQRST